jgi:hypothetical protein
LTVNKGLASAHPFPGRTPAKKWELVLQPQSERQASGRLLSREAGPDPSQRAALPCLQPPASGYCTGHQKLHRDGTPDFAARPPEKLAAAEKRIPA